MSRDQFHRLQPGRIVCACVHHFARADRHFSVPFLQIQLEIIPRGRISSVFLKQRLTGTVSEPQAVGMPDQGRLSEH